MNKETIQDFTARISQANRSGLTVITYDIIDEYLKEAQAAGEYTTYREAIRSAIAGIRRLQKTLDFKYEVSAGLFEIYRYSISELQKASVIKNKDAVGNIRQNLLKLREAFFEVSKTDDSPQLMGNRQNVTVGMTYGKGTLGEDFGADESRRGFWA